MRGAGRPRAERPRRIADGGPLISRRRELIAVLCLLGSLVCWAIPPVMLRHFAVADLIPDGYTTNLVRYPVSTVLYIPLIAWAARRRGLGRFWYAALLPAAVNVIGQTFFAVAPYYMPAGTMSFLARVAIVWSILGAFVFFPDERRLARSPYFWAGAALSLGGFAIMAFAALGTGDITRAGMVIILLCGVFWGLYDVTVRYTMRDLHPLVVFGVIGNYTSLGLILLAPLGEPASVLRLPPAEAALLAASAFIGIAAAHGLYYVAIQRLGITVSAITLMLTPFLTLLAGHVFLHERLSGRQRVGGLILIAGATLALWSRQRLSRRPPAMVDPNPD
ncbi:MAG: DMT family transporter [Phycisphaerae bacterium]